MGVNRSYKKQLPIPLQLAYGALENGLNDCRESIRVFGTTVDSLNQSIEALRKDLPLLFYVGNFKFQLSGLVATVFPDYTYSHTDILQLRKKCEEKIAKVSSVVISQDEWTKIKQIHDWFCQNIIYGETGNASHIIVGVFVNRKAVCEGIAKAAKAIFDEIGIESCVVTGNAISPSSNMRESHAWNKVKVDNKWYNLDMTFDLTLKGKNLRYDYFLLSDEEFALDHDEEPNSGIRCNSNDQSYYKKMGLVMQAQQQLVDYIKSNLGNSETLIVKLPSAQTPETVYQKVLKKTQEALHQLKLCKQINIRYNSTQLVFEIEVT